ncbi:peptidoglycan/xylan/chitin deacetylase (PgdA/CDA1 family) [Paenibacillus mucilaginosus]
MAGRRQAALSAVIRQAAIMALGIILLLLLLFPGTLRAMPEAEGNVYSTLKSGKRVDAGGEYKAAGQPTVYLTFDDGPSHLTPKFLDVLKEEGVPATFFVLGEQVEARPEVAKRIAEEGHVLGNHTYNHVYRDIYKDFSVFWEQLQHTEKAVQEAAGVRPRLVRAPGGTFGNFDAFYFYYLEQAGYQIHDWTIDSSDARRKGITADEIYGTVARGPFRQEAVVLMHDSAGHEETLKALPRIIRLFKDKGYVFAPLTPEVKPPQFSAGKPKWPRSSTPEGHAARLAEMRQISYTWRSDPAGEAPGVLHAPPSMLASGTAEGESRGPDQLDVVLDSRRLTLAKGEFEAARGGGYNVPLRELVEAMGGVVQWDDSLRTATARYAGHAVQYDFGRLELRLYRPGEATKVVPLPGMALKDGRVTVPLQGTLELLGSRILSSGGVQPGAAIAEVSARLYGNWWRLQPYQVPDLKEKAQV